MDPHKIVSGVHPKKMEVTLVFDGRICQPREGFQLRCVVVTADGQRHQVGVFGNNATLGDIIVRGVMTQHSSRDESLHWIASHPFCKS